MCTMMWVRRCGRRCCTPRFAGHALLLPALEHWKVLTHRFNVLLPGDRCRQILVHFIHELRAELDHLFHRAIHCELAILIAVDAIVFIPGAIGIRALCLLSQRHPATLTKLLFHSCSVCFCKGTKFFQIPARDLGRIWAILHQVPLFQALPGADLASGAPGTPSLATTWGENGLLRTRGFANAADSVYLCNV